jgi:hypothetical protein
LGTALLLGGLFILLVLGFFVAVVYCLLTLHDALAPDTPGQQRFLSASILNFLTQLEE